MPKIGNRYVGFGISTRVDLAARRVLQRALAGRGPQVERAPASPKGTEVDRYWGEHTLHRRPLLSTRESERYLRQRNRDYPLFTELMELYGDHGGETVLDYGCGPGDDVTGFVLYSRARQVVGIDVSARALGFARHRLALHNVDPGRVRLIQITDARGAIPLEDASVDYVHCGGVLHHTSHPSEILAEFNRVLRPGGTGSLMLYNRDSVMYHVYIAYAQCIRNHAFPGLDVDQAFQRSTDGPGCPISIAYSPARVLEMCAEAGFQARFLGGYVSVLELKWLAEFGAEAASDPRLADEHREFAHNVYLDERGLPRIGEHHAGVGGVYRIAKPGPKRSTVN